MIFTVPQPSVLLGLGWYRPQLHRGAARHAREHGWHLDAATAYYATVPADWSGDGVITQQFLVSDFCPATELLTRRNLPAVKIGFHIRNDDEAIGRLAATHLAGKGFERFAWVGRQGLPSQRETAFRQVLAVRGHECVTLSIDDDATAWSVRQGRWIEILSSIPRPLAVFAVTDDVAADVVTAATCAGLRVPDDVAVLGVRNDELICESLPVGLSSIDNNLEAVGYRAAELLHAHIVRGEPLPESPVLVPPSGVVERQSTSTLAVEHPDVRRALRFIQENFCRPIDADAVVAATSLSHRGLYKAFRQVLGRTIHEEVIRERLDLAKRLLRDTDAAVESVAADVGFGDARTMFTHFKRDTGSSPSEWRKTHRAVRR